MFVLIEDILDDPDITANFQSLAHCQDVTLVLIGRSRTRLSPFLHPRILPISGLLLVSWFPTLLLPLTTLSTSLSFGWSWLITCLAIALPLPLSRASPSLLIGRLVIQLANLDLLLDSLSFCSYLSCWFLLCLDANIFSYYHIGVCFNFAHLYSDFLFLIKREFLLFIKQQSTQFK